MKTSAVPKSLAWSTRVANYLVHGLKTKIPHSFWNSKKGLNSLRTGFGNYFSPRWGTLCHYCCLASHILIKKALSRQRKLAFEGRLDPFWFRIQFMQLYQNSWSNWKCLRSIHPTFLNGVGKQWLPLFSFFTYNR